MRRGLTLTGTVWLLSFLTTLMFCLVYAAEQVQYRIDSHKQQQQAAAMCVSGKEYLRVMRPDRPYRSPVFQGGGRFEVRFDEAGSPVVVGLCGRSRMEARP